MVGKLVALPSCRCGEVAVGVDDIDAGDFGFFAAVLGVAGHEQRLAVGRKTVPLPL